MTLYGLWPSSNLFFLHFITSLQNREKHFGYFGACTETPTGFKMDEKVKKRSKKAGRLGAPKVWRI